MMKVKEDSYDVGVIVGRFQVPELHQGHRDLIQAVCNEHDKVIIVLGMSPLMVTRENPLDFEARKQMLLDAFPRVNVIYARDMPSDELWSRRLDDQISDLITPAQTAVLYGGRDSFMVRYHGKLPVKELEADSFLSLSGKEIRKKIAQSSVKSSPDFRQGVVWAAFSQYPKNLATVDVAVWKDDDKKRLLLGRKPLEKKFRFLGGFSSPQSPTYEADARREVQEEAGIEITDPVYVISITVDDWRYRSEVDKIKTLLFEAKYLHGAIRPGDDIAEVRWFDRDALNRDDVEQVHWPLLEALGL